MHLQDRYWVQVLGTGFGVRPSVLGPRLGRSMRQGRISLPPIPPWPRAGSRVPRTEPGNAPMGFAYPMCAFSGSRARSSVLGVRPSASIRYRVPGARYPGPGTRYRVLVFEKPAHGVCMMQDRAESHPAYPMGAVPGSVLGARYPAFSHRRMRGEGDTTFPCPSPPRPGRGPRTESRPPNPAPLPYCPIALLPYCPTAFPSFWTRHSLTHLQIFEIIVHYSCL